MRAFGRDPLRGGHHGQRPFAPQQQVEHMAAPTSSASPVTKTLPTGRRPHMALSRHYLSAERCRLPRVKQTLSRRAITSAPDPKRTWRTCLLDHLVSKGEHRRRNGKPKCFGGV